MLPKGSLEKQQADMRENNAIDFNNLCPQCGRFAEKVHCPVCGSYVVSGYARRDVVTRSDGTVVQLTKYRCRRCSEVFNDDRWKTNCRAMPIDVGKLPKADRQPRPKYESLDDAPSEMVEALRQVQEMRRKRGE